ncbi:IPT/TIG domain-containing protein [Methanospirillum lacunae]|nr:IPT/TIG domain-containing protein [Methanospirillum lacunae]
MRNLLANYYTKLGTCMTTKVMYFSLALILCLICTGVSSAVSTTDPSPKTTVISSNVKASVTSITPATGKLGETVPFILNGTELSKNIKVYLENGDTKNSKSIIANAVNVTSPTSLTGSFNIPQTSTLGAWNVTVKEAGEIFPSNVTFMVTK